MKRLKKYISNIIRDRENKEGKEVLYLLVKVGNMLELTLIVKEGYCEKMYFGKKDIFVHNKIFTTVNEQLDRYFRHNYR